MLDQDPDALIAVADKMSADDFAVAPMPTGPSGKSYPALGYGGWAMFADSKAKDATWKVISYLTSPKPNLAWSKFVGVLPIHNGAEDDPFFARPQFAGWFTEMKSSERYEFVTVPSHLENMGIFFDSMAPKGFQEILLNLRPAKEVAADWAKYLTEQQQAWLAKNRK
jgi:multiple sugar transport system substrate-binding protein